MPSEAHRSSRNPVERAHYRRTGGREKAVQTASEAAKTQSDWWGVCRKCGERLEGSLAQLKEHDCGPAS